MDELTPQKERLALWMATPRHERKPNTLEKLSDEMGVNLSTVYRWKKEPMVRMRAQEYVDDVVGGPEKIRMVVEKIFEDAMKGSTKDKELFLRYAGVYVDRKVIEHVESEAETMTQDEIEAELADGWEAEFQQVVEDEDWDGDT